MYRAWDPVWGINNHSVGVYYLGMGVNKRSSANGTGHDPYWHRTGPQQFQNSAFMQNGHPRRGARIFWQFLKYSTQKTGEAMFWPFSVSCIRWRAMKMSRFELASFVQNRIAVKGLLTKIDFFPLRRRTLKFSQLIWGIKRRKSESGIWISCPLSSVRNYGVLRRFKGFAPSLRYK